VSDVVVSFSGLTKSFPGMAAPALDALTGEIRAGCITGLVGPDGAGKTTLLRLIAGLLVPGSGRLTTLGRDPVLDAAAIHRELGYMPQKFGLYEDLSVLENLTLHADLRNVTGAQREKTFDRLLGFTDLRRFTGRFAGKLSGGMKQKLGLACALLGTPRLLLLDEPGTSRPAMSRNRVVFPAPSGPTRPVMQPARISPVSASRAGEAIPGKDFVKSLKLTTTSDTSPRGWV